MGVGAWGKKLMFKNVRCKIAGFAAGFAGRSPEVAETIAASLGGLGIKIAAFPCFQSQRFRDTKFMLKKFRRVTVPYFRGEQNLPCSGTPRFRKAKADMQCSQPNGAPRVHATSLLGSCSGPCTFKHFAHDETLQV